MVTAINTIEVMDKPFGETNTSSKVLTKDMDLANITGADAYSSKIHYIEGKFDEKLVNMLEHVASNHQIHDITIKQREEFEKEGGF